MAHRKDSVFRIVWAILLLAGIGALACAPRAAPAPAPAAAPAVPPPVAPIKAEQSAWEKVVSDAKKEGQLIVYSNRSAGEGWKNLTSVFTSRYGVKVEGVAARGAELLERMKVEQRTGQTVGDLQLGGPTSSADMAKEGFTASLKDLPEVQRQGVWQIDPTYYPEAKLVVFTFSAPHFPAVNTKLVKPGEEPQTWQDLLHPRWKGQMVMDDPGLTGAGNIWTGLSLRHGIFDMEFLRKLAQQDVQIERNYNRAFTIVGSGERAMAISITLHDTFVSFVKKGAPLKPIDMKDGAVTSVYVINLARAPAHPNAARLFANWLLTEEGQATWAREMDWWPTRKGIPAAVHPSIAFKNYTKLVIPTLEDNVDIIKYVREGTIAALFRKK